jgi:putative hemolysin
MPRQPEPRPVVQIPVPSTLPLLSRAALTVARPLLSWAVALDTYRVLYERARTAPGDSFCARALHTLAIGVDFARGELLSVPAAGPLIVVANHPHGMLDGLALATVIEQTRPDVRILTNDLISKLPELPDLCFFIDPSRRGQSASGAFAGLRAAKRWLANGHALIVFPSGIVAHTNVAAASTALDAPWHGTVARLARRHGAPVLPAFIEGRNSDWFYRAGRIHPALRTLRLPRELLLKRGGRVTIRLGRPISFAPGSAARTSGCHAITLLRQAVETLGARPHLIDAEIAALGSDCRLLASGPFDVYCARASQIPTLLEEIGRLREVTFRGVGEGTGKAIDLDEFDNYYLHLFVWNRERKELVGAYRLGLSDEIVAARGVKGLYTSTLFSYDARLLDRLSPSIELGRSFVREEYQRSSSALLLLWKGIAAFVSRSRRYRVLFGPVSISSRYAESSRQMLQAFLAQHFYYRELGELVHPLMPAANRALPNAIDYTAVTTVQQLDRAVADREEDGKGIPVLLRQYLRLGARLLGFNVDPAFGNVLDALMMVDLAVVDRAILNRYFGKAEAAALVAAFAARKAA